jgi:hypothetical protein
VKYCETSLATRRCRTPQRSPWKQGASPLPARASARGAHRSSRTAALAGGIGGLRIPLVPKVSESLWEPAPSGNSVYSCLRFGTPPPAERFGKLSSAKSAHSPWNGSRQLAASRSSRSAPGRTPLLGVPLRTSTALRRGRGRGRRRQSGHFRHPGRRTQTGDAASVSSPWGWNARYGRSRTRLLVLRQLDLLFLGWNEVVAARRIRVGVHGFATGRERGGASEKNELGQGGQTRHVVLVIEGCLRSQCQANMRGGYFQSGRPIKSYTWVPKISTSMNSPTGAGWLSSTRASTSGESAALRATSG